MRVAISAATTRNPLLASSARWNPASSASGSGVCAAEPDRHDDHAGQHVGTYESCTGIRESRYTPAAAVTAGDRIAEIDLVLDPEKLPGRR